MAMNKSEKAELAAAKKQARMHELSQLKPPLLPDIPAPKNGSHQVIIGWTFNAHSFRTFQVESTSISHYFLDSAGRRSARGSGSQGARSLYSTKELAREAMQREVIRATVERLYELEERNDFN